MTSQRLLGLPAVARLSLFARHKGPAVLLTTQERYDLYKNADAFAVAVSQGLSLSTWPDKYEKVVLQVSDALKAFPENPDAFALSFDLGNDYPRESLLETLIEYGYDRDEQPGFVVKGDTLSLYLDEDSSEALRLEFFGDELDAINHKEKRLDHFLLRPRVELHDDSWTNFLLEMLPGKVFLDTPELFAGNLTESQCALFWQYLSTRDICSFGRDSLDLPEGDIAVETLGYYRAKLSDFRSDLELWLKDGYSVNLLLKFERTGRYLREKLLDDLPSQWQNSIKHHPGKLGLLLSPHTSGGFRDAQKKEIILTEELLYGYQGARKLKRLPGKRIRDAVQLAVGDYLIHPDHGVGCFKGLEPREVLGVTRDYLILHYAAEGKLYLPVENLHFLRRHPGTTDDPPRLSTLGTNEWARAREKARLNAQALAAELIKTYAKRQITQGLAMPEVEDWDHLIDDNCPFTLTTDQMTAVEAAYRDMSQAVPMDRLISGDVGFGKTEVAIRVAHRAVGNAKQVAMLVPTTVLAKQHYETFKKRFADLPVTVRALSRFTSSKEAKEIAKGMANGSVDIVIGTHRILNQSLKFKDLGLLIIDEEHRFGVGQKEKMKALKANLDVLSLSATPIPRTLYMSLVGLRDVSQIMTPPEGRLPIQTVLERYDPLSVREAIMFELERGGKIFYIHDRIGSMGMRAKALAQLVPETRIGVAHGQMGADELEEVMMGFQEGAFDILLSTTIVESGLDITGANTLVIERADKLGLAQLYQLRGRVGRRKTEAWAYLFYPGRITEQAQRRLYAIAELNDLGSGHLLAEKDMEIRGIGNLLGPEQHGHVSAVSLEVYTEMLAEEVAKLKGEAKEEPMASVAIDLGIDARLSPSYISHDDKRIEYYGRLSETRSLAEVVRIAKEIREAYGPLPKDVKAFIELVKIRLLAASKGLVSIQEHMTDVQLSFSQGNVDYDAKGIKELPYTVEPSKYPPGFSIKKRGLNQEDLLLAISRVLYLCA